MNFSVETAMQLGAARQGGRESMIPQLDSASHLLQLAEFRADDTQRRMNVKSLQDLGTFSKANLYAIADSENDIRVLPSISKIGETLQGADPSGYQEIFHPRGGQRDLDTRNITSAVEQRRITQVSMQAPSVPGVTKTYKLPSGYTLLRIATPEEIAAAEAAEAAAEEESDEESDDDDQARRGRLYQGAQIVQQAEERALADEYDNYIDDEEGGFDLYQGEQIIEPAEGQDLADEYDNSGIFDDDAEDEYL